MWIMSHNKKLANHPQLIHQMHQIKVFYIFLISCLWLWFILFDKYPILHDNSFYCFKAITVVPLPVRATRGPNKYSFIWNLPENHKIELPLTSSNQPINKAGRNFTGWLGTIARKSHLCPIKYKNWTGMPDEFKEQIWDLVQVFRKL